MINKYFNYFFVIIGLIIITTSVYALADIDNDGYKDISSCSGLSEINKEPSLNYEIINNIDCSNITFTEIGTQTQPFTGKLKGNGYRIDSLTINSQGSCVGLFAYTSGTTISSLNLLSLTINSNSVNGDVGGLIGCATNTAISNITVSGKINCDGSENSCAGIIGKLNSGNITQSRAIATINSTTSNVGGLVGLYNCGTTCEIQESYFEGEIEPAQNFVGGLVGKHSSGTLRIYNSFANASITANQNAGGIATSTGSLEINNSYSIGSFSNGNLMIGGLVFTEGSSRINNCFTTIDISSRQGENGVIGSGVSIISYNNWWYNNSSAQNYSDVNETGNGVGITKASGISDFYNSDFNVYTGEGSWDTKIWDFEGKNYPTLIWTEDTDEDGILDIFDSITAGASAVSITGLSGNLNIIVGENGNINNIYTGTQNIKFNDGNKRLFSFDYNFDKGVLDLSKIKIKVGTNSLLVNLGNQLQTGFTKTMYLTNNNFSKLCVKNEEINNISDITTNCTGNNEYNFIYCLNGSYSSNNINCTYNSNTKLLTFTGLTKSGIIGVPQVTPPGGNTGGSGGSGNGGTTTPPVTPPPVTPPVTPPPTTPPITSPPLIVIDDNEPTPDENTDTNATITKFKLFDINKRTIIKGIIIVIIFVILLAIILQAINKYSTYKKKKAILQNIDENLRKKRKGIY